MEERERRGRFLTRKGLKGGVILFLNSFSHSMFCRRRRERSGEVRRVRGGEKGRVREEEGGQGRRVR